MPAQLSEEAVEVIGRLTTQAEAQVDRWRLGEMSEDACNAVLDTIHTLTRAIRLDHVPPEAGETYLAREASAYIAKVVGALAAKDVSAAQILEQAREREQPRERRIRSIIEGTAGEEARALMQREEDVDAALYAYTHTKIPPVPDALHDALECHFKLPNDDLTVEEEDELVRLWRAAGSPVVPPDEDSIRRDKRWMDDYRARRVLAIIEQAEAEGQPV